jgi:hypothetical protein
MDYSIKAHPTKYSGVLFRSRLEARWACFFDIIRWKWEYEPIDINGWTPDFYVEYPCGHSECNGSHRLFAEVKPYFRIEEFRGHPCMDYSFGGWPQSEGGKGLIDADSGAALGINPGVTHWEIAHGGGGGSYTLQFEIPCWVDQWNEAGRITQWRPSSRAQIKTQSNKTICDITLEELFVEIKQARQLQGLNPDGTVKQSNGHINNHDVNS